MNNLFRVAPTWSAPRQLRPHAVRGPEAGLAVGRLLLGASEINDAELTAARYRLLMQTHSMYTVCVMNERGCDDEILRPPGC